MKAILLSICTATLLSAASDPQVIVNEVTKLRQKYEECRAGQSVVQGIEPKLYNECTSQRNDLDKKVKGYQKRITSLEAQIKQETLKRTAVEKESQAFSRELGQKRGVIKSLEQTLSARDRDYRDASARNKNLTAQLHTQQVSKQEREMLKRSLLIAKEELAEAQKQLNGGSTSVQQLREELKKAKSTIVQLQKAPVKVQAQEKIVTKVVQPTEQIVALQRELAAAQMTIANLKTSDTKVVYKDRIVTQEKVVYKDRPVEKIVTKVVQPTEQIVALQRELAAAKTTIANLKKGEAKVVYKDRIVTQEKVVYKDRPVEKVITKTVESTEKIKALQAQLNSANAKIAQLQNTKPKVQIQEKIVEKTVIKADETTQRKLDKMALELERAKSLNLKLSRELAYTQNKQHSAAVASAGPSAPKTVKVTPKSSPVLTASSSSKSAKKSSAYRMANNAPIYTAPGGRQIDTWEARRSFTAGEPSGGWVHITGYFVNRVWQPTAEHEHLWVKESDVIRR